MDDDDAPGWDAIDAALAPLVGDRQPLHFGTNTGLPDQDGIWGLSGYRMDDHWFYVTYGLTELFAKVSDVPDVSGWGHELTLRLVATDDELPQWPLNLLHRLGQLVFERGTPFDPGGYLEFPGVSAPLPPSVAFTTDPWLATVDGPNGRFGFTAVAGLTLDLLARARADGLDATLAPIRAENPLLVCGGPGLTW